MRLLPLSSLAVCPLHLLHFLLTAKWMTIPPPFGTILFLCPSTPIKFSSPFLFTARWMRLRAQISLYWSECSVPRERWRSSTRCWWGNECSSAATTTPPTKSAKWWKRLSFLSSFPCFLFCPFWRFYLLPSFFAFLYVLLSIFFLSLLSSPHYIPLHFNCILTLPLNRSPQR